MVHVSQSGSPLPHARTASRIQHRRHLPRPKAKRREIAAVQPRPRTGEASRPQASCPAVSPSAYAQAAPVCLANTLTCTGAITYARRPEPATRPRAHDRRPATRRSGGVVPLRRDEAPCCGSIGDDSGRWPEAGAGCELFTGCQRRAAAHVIAPLETQAGTRAPSTAIPHVGPASAWQPHAACDLKRCKRHGGSWEMGDGSCGM